MKPFNICIATPCFGGQVTSQYAGSLADLTSFWSTGSRKFSHSIYMLNNESQIHRARNKCVVFARAHEFTHLLFIDADLGFRPEHVMRLIDAGKRVIGGTYPVKKLPIKLNFNALPSETPDAAGILKVRHVPTGFLLIDMKVFEDLEPYMNSCTKEDLITGAKYDYVEFFLPGIESGEDDSEDWKFCRRVQTHLQENVYLHTKCILPHVGSFEYRAEGT